jgi:hypothetical protein
VASFVPAVVMVRGALHDALSTTTSAIKNSLTLNSVP